MDCFHLGSSRVDGENGQFIALRANSTGRGNFLGALYAVSVYLQFIMGMGRVSSVRNPAGPFFGICDRAMDSQKLLASVCFRSVGGYVVGGRDSGYPEHPRSSEAGPLASAVPLRIQYEDPTAATAADRRYFLVDCSQR